MPKSFTPEEIEVAKLRLAFLKENVDFAKFYKELAKDPYELCPELRKPEEDFDEYRHKIHKLKIYGTPFFGGYANQFGINDKFFYELQLLPALKELPLNSTENTPPVSTEDVLNLLNPEADFDKVSCPELIEMLPLMFHTAGVNEIETISSISTTPKKKSVPPSKTLIKAVTARILATKDLSRELPFIQIAEEKKQSAYLKQLSTIVAYHLYYQHNKNSIKAKKVKSIDLSKKTDKRWRNRAIDDSKRDAQLKRFFKVSFRELMAKEDASLAEKRYPSYRSMVLDLYYFFSIQTPHPYRYMAAIIGLFNLHPRGFCKGCKYLPEKRKKRKKRKQSSKRKIQSLTQKVRRGIDMCKIEEIFRCPKHKTGRSNLNKVIKDQIQATG